MDIKQPLMNTAKHFYTGNITSLAQWSANSDTPHAGGADSREYDRRETGLARPAGTSHHKDAPAFQSLFTRLGSSQKEPVAPVPAGRVQRGEHVAPVSGQEGQQESLSTMIKVCAHTGDVARVEELLQRIIDTEQQLSVETYNYIIHTCTQAGDMVRVEQYMLRMEESGFAPNLVTYNSVINACAAMGDAAQAEKWLMRMINKGMQPNHVTYGTICKVFARQGGVDQVQGIMKLLEGSGTPLNEYFYASLISACGAANPPDLERAENALFDLARRGLRPQSVKRALARVVGDKRTMELFRSLGRLSVTGPGPSQCAQLSAAGRGQGGEPAVPTGLAGGLPRGAAASPERRSGRGAASAKIFAPHQDRGWQGQRGGRAVNQTGRAQGSGKEGRGGRPVFPEEPSRRAKGRGRGLGKASGRRAAGPHVGTDAAAGRGQSYIPGAMLLQAASSADAPNSGSTGAHDVLRL